MSYQVRFTETNNALKTAITVEDQTINTALSVAFVGKNYSGYGQVIAENFLHLLENFAGPTRPTSPVQGQIYFNNNTGVNQLEVWDGTAWSSTGGVKKSEAAPSVNNAIKGDLWVNTNTQQLYLFNGSAWILVGPNFSEGAKSGPQVETIVDLTDTTHAVITLWVADERVSIVSKDEFTPKSALPGFTIIKKGINLSSTADYKHWGTSEKANALVVGNDVVPAGSFLRGDVTSSTAYGINVRNAAGVAIGSDLSFTLTTDNNAAVLYNKISGASIDLKVNTGSTASTVIRVDSTTNVGINKTNPTVALDVNGSISTNGTLAVTSTTDASSLTLASFKTAGGAAIGKKLIIGSTATVNGQLVVSYQDTNGDPITGAAILPGSDAANGLYDIGTPTRTFNNVYANNFVGTFSGSFSGTIGGTTTTYAATRLSSTTNFSMTGDVVTTTPLAFNGVTTDGSAIFNTTITSDFITSKSLVADSNDSDVFIMYRAGAGLKKIAKSTLFSNVATIPVGGIIPFAGTVVPNGFLLCDGSEVSIAKYGLLFAAINYTYRDQSLLLGYSTFALPDLRGRFALGRDDMDNGGKVFSAQTGGGNNPVSIDAGGGSANRVTDTAADSLGAGSGSETVTLSKENLPEHSHTMRGKVGGNLGNQYYAVRNASGDPADAGAIKGLGGTAPGQAQYLPDSGGVDTPLGMTLSTPLNTMNPYLTINYIIYTGVTA